MTDMIRTTPEELGLPHSFPMPARRDWGIGMIGFGRIARYAHVPAYRRASWQVVAVADPEPTARKAAADEFGIETVYEDYHDLIDDESVQIVDLLTHPSIREDVISAAIDAKKPIITEKPLGPDLETCLRMVEVAERAGIPLAVHQNYRWRPANFLAYQAVRHGLVGDPFFLGFEVFGNQDIDLAEHPFYAKAADFITLQWNTHPVDLAAHLAGKPALRTFAATQRMPGQNFVSDNLICALTDFGEGLTGHILHHELLRGSRREVQCRVDGNKGSVTFDFDSRLVVHSELLGDQPRRVDVSYAQYEDSFAGTMGDFLLAIEEGREPSVSGRQNLATIRTVLAQAQSANNGGVWVGCE